MAGIFVSSVFTFATEEVVYEKVELPTTLFWQMRLQVRWDCECCQRLFTQN